MPPKRGRPAKAASTAKAPTAATTKKSAAAPTTNGVIDAKKSATKKRKASEDSSDAPPSKKAATGASVNGVKKVAVGKSSVPKPPAAKQGRPAKKAVQSKTNPKSAPKSALKRATESPESIAQSSEAEKIAEEVATAESAAISVPDNDARPPPPKKALPVINHAPTKRLDVFVFGEGSQGELGLGSKIVDGKNVIDVLRPRLNARLSAKDVGVVQIAVGGMHCAALTHDNKILTWGVNDNGALGRMTTNEGKMKDIDADDSDSDSEDDDSGLNPSESEPREIDLRNVPEGTIFTALIASDSCTFALTSVGTVYGCGTIRANEGVLGFRIGTKTQVHMALIPELKKIVSLAAGTNHILALDNKGKVFTWGAGEQNQLARRIVSRTSQNGLVPREFGLQRKKIVHIGCGDYNSFAIDAKGDLYAWGLNSYSQSGIPKPSESEEDNTLFTPTLVQSVKGFDIKQIAGGSHHSIAVTTDGKVLILGRISENEGGMDISEIPKEKLVYNGEGKPAYVTEPLVVPNIKGTFVATANDTNIVITEDGKAYSWGFNENYQTGQGRGDSIIGATLMDNTAVRGKKLVFAGVGGQFGVLGGIYEDASEAQVNGD